MTVAVQRWAVPVLRLGLVGVFFWFGYMQVSNPEGWVVWVPEWATALSGIEPVTIVMMNGWFELVAGTLLLVGVAVRVVALLLALHLFVIAFEIGLTGIGVRDFGLAMATLALALHLPDTLTLDAWRARRAVR